MAEYGGFWDAFGQSAARTFNRELAAESQSRRKVRGFKELRKHTDKLGREKEQRATTSKREAAGELAEFLDIPEPLEDLEGRATEKALTGELPGRQASPGVTGFLADVIKGQKKTVPPLSPLGKLQRERGGMDPSSLEYGEHQEAITKAITKEPRGVTPSEIAFGAAGFNPRSPEVVKNLTESDWDLIAKEYAQLGGQLSYERGKGTGRADIDRPRITPKVRDDLGQLEVGLTNIQNLMSKYDTSFTGIESMMWSIRAAMGDPQAVEFSQFRAEAQVMYSGLRRVLIGTAQSVGELATLKRAMPADATKLSDAEYLGVIRSTATLAKTQLGVMSRVFKLPPPAILEGNVLGQSTSNYGSKEEVREAVSSGEISREEGLEILRTQFDMR